jgi:hypothetical protein
VGKAPDYFTIAALREHFHCVMAIFEREDRRDAALVGNVVPFPSPRTVAP